MATETSDSVNPNSPRPPQALDPQRLLAELNNERRLVQSLLGSFDCCVLQIDPEGKVCGADEAACALLGYLPDELAGKPARSVLEPVGGESGASLTEQLLHQVREVSLISSNGDRSPATLAAASNQDASGDLRHLTCVFSDMSAARQAQLEQNHSQKLESVGLLASGIAHEINTPIQFIGDSTRFLQDSFQDLQRILEAHRELIQLIGGKEECQPLLTKIQELEEEVGLDFLESEIPLATAQTLEGIDRVATIVRAMRSFAHPGRGERTACDLNEALQTTLTVSRNEYKYLADVRLQLNPIPEVYCNIGELNQVFLNLIVNAAHAIADRVKGTGERGTIGVRTGCTDTHVEVQISDTGIGIPPSIKARIFEPFFTTKEVGRGTGQGLALVHKIIAEAYSGEVDFESFPGEGTTFFIRLPLRSANRGAA